MLLQEVPDDAVIVFDGPNGQRPLTPAEFSAMWGRQALLVVNRDSGACELRRIGTTISFSPRPDSVLGGIGLSKERRY